MYNILYLIGDVSIGFDFLKSKRLIKHFGRLQSRGQTHMSIAHFFSLCHQRLAKRRADTFSSIFWPYEQSFHFACPVTEFSQCDTPGRLIVTFCDQYYTFGLRVVSG